MFRKSRSVLVSYSYVLVSELGYADGRRQWTRMPERAFCFASASDAKQHAATLVDVVTKVRRRKLTTPFMGSG